MATETPTAPTAPVEEENILVGQTPEAAPAEESAPAEFKPAPFDPKEIPDKFWDKENGTVKLNDLVKSYKEAEKRALEKNPPAPEAYDFETPFKEYNLAWENDEQKDFYVGKFKELGLSQEKVNNLLALHAKSLQDQMQQSTIAPADKERELGVLRSEWGDQFAARAQAVQEFHKTLPAELQGRGLLATAAGAKMLWDMSRQQKGPSVMRETVAIASNADDLNVELATTVSNPKYGQNTAEGKMLRSRAAKISEQLSKMRR